MGQKAGDLGWRESEARAQGTGAGGLGETGQRTGALDWCGWGQRAEGQLLGRLRIQDTADWRMKMRLA